VALCNLDSRSLWIIALPANTKEKPAKKPALGTITLIANQPEIDQNYQ